MNASLLITLISYAVVWFVALYFFWRAYRLFFKDELRYVKGLNGEYLKNRKKFAKPCAVIEFLTGASIIAFLVAVPVFALPLRIWPAFFLVIGASRKLQILKFARQDENQSRVQ